LDRCISGGGDHLDPVEKGSGDLKTTGTWEQFDIGHRIEISYNVETGKVGSWEGGEMRGGSQGSKGRRRGKKESNRSYGRQGDNPARPRRAKGCGRDT